MKKIICSWCGRAIAAAREDSAAASPRCCSLGCVLRARVPVDAQGNFPVNRYLGAALTVGFFFFNQLLCSGMSVFALRQGRGPLAAKFESAAIISAAVVFFAVEACQLFSRTLRAKEALLAAIAFALLVRGAATAPPSHLLLALATGLVLFWSGRGVFRGAARV